MPNFYVDQRITVTDNDGNDYDARVLSVTDDDGGGYMGVNVIISTDQGETDDTTSEHDTHDDHDPNCHICHHEAFWGESPQKWYESDAAEDATIARMPDESTDMEQDGRFLGETPEAHVVCDNTVNLEQADNG